jgi:2-oxoglutarate ferredoxin oxidoreductase subunit gamma
VANKIEVKIGGHGGQGVVLAGQILGKAAVYDGKNALQTQTYGAEARGSLAGSEVIISDGKIGFPAVRKCDVLVAMNQKSLEVHLKDLKEDGILMVDSGNVGNIPETKAKIFKIPMTETAKKTFGESLYANMIMLGALTKITSVASEESMEKAIKDSVPERTVETNLNAYRKGLQLQHET